MSASGVAAAINPNGPEGQQIHLFYNTNTKNLGFQFFDETKHKDETEAFAAGVDGVTGCILNPAQVATANLAGVDFVLGFTNKPKPAAVDGCHCPEPTQNDVSIISPVYKPLDVTDLTNLTIAATSSDATAWVYFLTGTDAPKIRELTLGDDARGQFSRSLPIIPNSSLAAFYVPENDHRYIVFQNSDDQRLSAFCPVPGKTHDDVIDETGDARLNTPLAAVYVRGKAYLYYVDRSDSIRVIAWDRETKAWGDKSRAVNAPSQVDKGSQLTVVPSHAGNHIFYVGRGQSQQFTFRHAIDKI
jgi:hypothetical protein